ncbi:hypothetical protein HZA97_04585 [Candidatus Woesearchaeota archaeon]|nr:hypothetical protein [Candidatus Woesearchaeota archaeon]
MYLKFEVMIFLLILVVALSGLLTYTGYQIVELPSFKETPRLQCPVLINVKDFSPKNYVLNNPLITGRTTSELCSDASPYHVKVGDKLYARFECTRNDVVTFRSCSTGQVLLNGVLTEINLEEDNFHNGLYEGSWKCAQGQQCTVEKRGTGLFRGCEAVQEPIVQIQKKQVELKPIEFSCEIEITYVDFKTEIIVKDSTGKKIEILLGSEGEIPTKLELKEKEPGIYSRTLIFREPKTYKISYGNFVLPLEVMPIPQDLYQKELKKAKEKAIKSIKNIITSII